MHENCAATSDVPKTTSSVSKLKRTHVSNTQSPPETQTKQARVTSCDKLASCSAVVRHPQLGRVTFYYCFCPKCFNVGAQIPVTRLLCQLNFVWWYLICVWILKMEYLACHRSGAYNCKVSPRFLENLCTHGIKLFMCLKSLNTFQQNLNFRVCNEGRVLSKFNMVYVSPPLTSTLQRAHIIIMYLLKNYSFYDLFGSR
jgi:hypothetical protein